MDLDEGKAGAQATGREDERRKTEKGKKKRGPEAEEEGDDLYSFPLDNRSGKLAKWNTWEKKEEASRGSAWTDGGGYPRAPDDPSQGQHPESAVYGTGSMALWLARSTYAPCASQTLHLTGELDCT